MDKGAHYIQWYYTKLDVPVQMKDIGNWPSGLKMTNMVILHPEISALTKFSSSDL